MTPPAIPPQLLKAINEGRCVAFVGAGFSAAAGLPQWKDLLTQIAKNVPLEHRHLVERITKPGASAHDFDRAAQMLSDHLRPPQFIAQLKQRLVPSTPLPERMMQRLRWLRGIPFRAILTVNFDGVLKGSLPEPNTYREILRRERSHWWGEEFLSEDPPGPPVVKLHGDLLAPKKGAEQIVLTREDYRRRLYHDPAYMSFLRAVLSTSTVLYLGFSFEDAYLNELRSEALSMLGYKGQHKTQESVAYALMNDVDPAVAQHFKRHEGIEIISYNSKRPSNFKGFDDWLGRLYKEASPLARLGKLLSKKRLLWMDSTPDAEYGANLLSDAAREHGRGQEPIAIVTNAVEALSRLRKAQESKDPFDLVISRWEGDRTQGEGYKLLQEMRRSDVNSPVLIFAGQEDAEERKRLALSLGALHYCHKFETLFRKIEEVFLSAAETW